MRNNKITYKFYTIIILNVFLLLAISCDKTDPEIAKESVTLSVELISNITESTADVTGKISYDGYTKATAVGICWSTKENPTISDFKIMDGTGVGIFISELRGLQPRTIYYVRVYASTNTETYYGNSLSFKTKSNSVDGDGNEYQIVTIGTQNWLAENLRTTKFNDGTPIPLVTDKEAWAQLTESGYCWYDNDKAKYGETYGALYNYYAVKSGKLCPKGWHVPSDEERLILSNHFGDDSLIGGKLKETGTKHWASPNTGASNEVGFTALPGGFRNPEGEFFEVGVSGLWWSDTKHSTDVAFSYLIYSDNSAGYTRHRNYRNGLSIRCIRD